MTPAERKAMEAAKEKLRERNRRLGKRPPEEMRTLCPVCHKDVVSRWVKGGMLHDNTIALIGDLLFHGDCWDKQVAEHPPGAGGFVSETR